MLSYNDYFSIILFIEVINLHFLNICYNFHRSFVFIKICPICLNYYIYYNYLMNNNSNHNIFM